MDFGISTRCFQNERLSAIHLERLKDADFTHIELHADRASFDYHERSLVRSITGWFRDNPLPAPSLHLPFEEDFGQGRKRPIPLLDSERWVREQAMDEIKRCLELTERLPVRYAVLHLGATSLPFTPARFDFAYSVIATIQAFAGIHVLLENLPKAAASLDTLREFKTVAQLEDIGICYDTGHGEWQSSKDRLELNFVEAIHIHDNNGREDQHLWPFDGAMDWPAFVETITLSKYGGVLVFEPAVGESGKAQECRSRLKDLIQEAANSIEEFRSKYNLPQPRSAYEEMESE